MIAYKLLRKKNDNKLYPLFIDKKNETKLGIWLNAKCIPTKGFAIREGFHCCYKPYAPHLKTELKSGEKRVWVECEIEDYETYNRPESQCGTWLLAKRIKLIRELTNNEVEELNTY